LTGRTLNNEYSDRARALLPSEYLNLSNNILISLCDRYLEYTNPTTIKVVVGTWNVNGGKHFKTMARKTEPLSDWLLDYKKKSNEINIMDLSLNNSLGELSEANGVPDIFAIGFEEIVDLNASNIVAASTTNQREWLAELQATISRDNSYVLVSKVQLVGVCLFVFVQPCHASFIRYSLFIFWI
jgi:AGAP012175-PA